MHLTGNVSLRQLVGGGNWIATAKVIFASSSTTTTTWVANHCKSLWSHIKVVDKRSHASQPNVFSLGAHQQCLIVPKVALLRGKPFTTRFNFRQCSTVQNSPTLIEKMALTSKIRMNYHEECEAGVNKQINLELYAAYVYQQLAFHFDRDDVALHGFSKFFSESSKEEREHAEKLMKFQNLRGGRIVLQEIPKPIKQDWASGLEAMEAALELEKTVNQSLLDLHTIASKHRDAQFADFLETQFLTEQVEAIRKLSGYVTNLHRVGKGLGEYLFDKETLQ